MSDLDVQAIQERAAEAFLLEVADAFLALAEERNFFRHDRDLLVIHNESLVLQNEACGNAVVAAEADREAARERLEDARLAIQNAQGALVNSISSPPDPLEDIDRADEILTAALAREHESLIQDAPRRTWHDLSEDEQARVKRLLTPDSDDNLDDLIARCERAVQIIRGES